MERIGKETYNWWGKHVGDYPVPQGFTKEELGKCNYCFGFPGREDLYELGVVYRDGKFHLLYDFYGSKGQPLMDLLGKKGEKLLQTYMTNVLIKVQLQQGHKLKSVSDINGKKIVIVET